MAVFTDTFDRASELLDASHGWHKAVGGSTFQAFGNGLRSEQDEPVGTETFTAYWNDRVPASPSSRVEITVTDAHDDIGVGARIDPATGDGYYAVAAHCGNASYLHLVKCQGGTMTDLDTFDQELVVADGDTIGLEVCGSHVSVLLNGVSRESLVAGVGTIFSTGRVGVGWLPQGQSAVYAGPFPEDGTVIETFSYPDGPLPGNGGWIRSTALDPFGDLDVVSGKAKSSAAFQAANLSTAALLSDAEAEVDWNPGGGLALSFLGVRVQANGDGIYVGMSTFDIEIRKYVGGAIVFSELAGGGVGVASRLGIRVKQIDATYAAVVLYSDDDAASPHCTLQAIVPDDGTPGRVGLLSADADQTWDNLKYGPSTVPLALPGRGDDFTVALSGFACGDENVSFSGVEFVAT